jgi:hypothetical protein
MTEQDIAIDYLKGIQRHYLIKRYGIDFEKKDWKMNSQKFYDFIEKGLKDKNDLTEDEKYELEAKLKGYFLDINFLNTNYESPADWFILASLLENIKRIIPTDTKLPFFGTVMSGDIKAEAYTIKNTNVKLIILESELFTCGNLLCKIIAQSIPLISLDKISFTFSIDKSKLDEHIKKIK